jgi:alginate O-acetyltransferase complex protein AlgI
MFVFLPVVILLVGILNRRFHNGWLLLASLYFYAWGSASHTIILLGSITANYFLGRYLSSSEGRSRAIRLGIAVGFNLLLLGYLKYANFFMENFNGFRSVLGYESIEFSKVALPIGVSFYTFQAISYLVDVHRKVAPVQKNYFDLALYISLFPQLVAGPIIRYNDVVDQLKNRVLSMNKAAQGVHRFIIGFAKKVIVANYFGAVADQVFAFQLENVSWDLAWLGIVSYTLQIYFDFSGYSDMAIGLGKIFGFDFMENFNLPYIANSIRDFWRRWHISLSTWFRDYLYIPLGGSRGSKLNTLRNLMIVFLLTGFWHGSSWTFVVWGVYHGAFLLLERSGFDAILKSLWQPVRVLYTLIVVMIGWVFFRAVTIEHALAFIKKLFFLADSSKVKLYALNYLDNKMIVMLMVAVFIALGGLSKLVNYVKVSYVNESNVLRFRAAKTVFGFLLLFLSISYLAGSTYNPFIYFRF